MELQKNRVEVVIDGQIITLVSDEPEAYMQKIALYIDKKLGEIKSAQQKPVSEHLRTLLISANIADDYFKALESKKTQLREVRAQQAEALNGLQTTNGQMAEKLQQLGEENALLTRTNHELQEQLHYARKELEDYISNFDTSRDPKVVSFNAGGAR